MKRVLAAIAAIVAAGVTQPAQGKETLSDTVSVLVIGDVMMHTRQLEYDHGTFLRHIAAKMKAADIAVANMEFTLAGEPYSGYPCFSAPDSYAEYIAGECGVDVFLTANNHIMDKGRKGIVRTLEKYAGMNERYGVQFTGSACDSSQWNAVQPLLIEKKGIRFAFINFTYGTNQEQSGWPKVALMDRNEICEAIAKARQEKADVVIALPHWGEEYKLTHNKEQEEWAEWLANQGVDLIIGSHPHVVQDTTHIGATPVFFSTGNVVSNMSAVNTRMGLSVTASFVKDRITGKVTAIEPVTDFTWCSLPGMIYDNYATIYVKEWIYRRGMWSTPSDYDNMIETLWRVKAACGIIDEGL